MKVVLVNPGGAGSWQGDVAVKNTQYMFPYSIIYLQNYLLKQNVESTVVDLFHEKVEDALLHCSDPDRLILGVTSQSFTRYEAIDFIKKVKALSPNTFAVVGGNHFSFCAKETLEKVPEIDAVARGEGEKTFYELVKTLSEDGEGDLSRIDGITYKENDAIIANRDRDPERDIENFSLDFDRLSTKNFRRGVFLRNFENEGIRSLPIHFARGCTRKCVFCSFGLTAYRVRRVEKVIEEIVRLKERFGCNYFTISDPSFCERKPFVKDFCERVIKDRIDIKWYCEARVDTPLDLLQLMAEAGCVSLDFAIESGSEKVLKAIRKNINIPQALEFARECKNLGIRTLVFLMVSLPDEKEEDAMETLKVTEQLSRYTKYTTLSVAQIVPGTELEKLARERNILPKDFSWYDQRFHHAHSDLAYENLPIYLENLSVDFIRKFKKEFNALNDRSFTTLPDLVRMMKKGMRRIPNQPLTKTVEDIKTFSQRVYNKITQQKHN